MFVIRPIHKEDEQRFINLALQIHTGITSLPKDVVLLRKKIELSLQSFQNNETIETENKYLFVLENVENNDIAGLCAVYTKVGMPTPYCYYRIKNEERDFPPNKSIKMVPQAMMEAVAYPPGVIEVGTLYLKPEYRKGGLGKLLSLSRFLFMAANRDRFSGQVIANMRGVFDSESRSPFWDSFGKRFTDLEYFEAVNLIQHDISLSFYLFPQHPVYLSLLPLAAQEVLGKAHHNTLPALNMLEKEGFHWNKYIDPLDGGPLLAANVHDIQIVNKSQLMKIKEVLHTGPGKKHCLVGTEQINFRAAYGEVKWIDNTHIALDKTSMRLLQVGVGDQVRIAILPNP